MLNGEERKTNSVANIKSNLKSLSDVMKIVGHILGCGTLVFLVLFIPAFAFYAVRDWDEREDLAAFYSAGAFVILTLPISTNGIIMHLTHWYMPDAQRHVVRILWMVPLYSIDSWLSLRYHQFNLYIDTVRDLYEAFVIQSFVYYLVEILGGEDGLTQILQCKGEHHHKHGEHPRLLFFIRKWEMDREFMVRCKHGVLQFVVVKTFMTILAAILEIFDFYGEGVLDWGKGYIYIAVVTNFSQMWALYCLVKFFNATKEDLRSPVNWHPVGKFLCIKGVVFFTWWQGLAIVILQDQGFIKDIGTWNADEVAKGLQDYLVCLEMLFFAVAHSYTFTHQEYSGTHHQPATVGDDECDNDDIAQMRCSHCPRALWMSTLPDDTLSDIRRMITGASQAKQYSDEDTVSDSDIDGDISIGEEDFDTQI